MVDCWYELITQQSISLIRLRVAEEKEEPDSTTR
jgi:hypothetical protein